MEALMEEQQAPSMEDLFNQYAAKGMVEEANRFRTVPKGTYSLQITKAEPKLSKKDENDPTKVQRPYLHFSATVLNAEGKRQAGVFFNASWVEGRTEKTGRLDGMSKLWGNIEKAFDVVGKSVGEVKEAVTKYPCRAYVDVVYVDPAFNRYYVNPAAAAAKGITEAELEKEYLTSGYEPQNTVLTITKVQ